MRSRWPDIGQVLVCIFMGQEEVKINKTLKEKKKKKRGKYPAILTEEALSIHDFLSGQRVYFCGTNARKPEQVRRAHLGYSGIQSEHRIRLLLFTRRFNHIIQHFMYWHVHILTKKKKINKVHSMLTLTTLEFEQHIGYTVQGKFRGLERTFYLMDSFTLLTNKVRFE